MSSPPPGRPYWALAALAALLLIPAGTATVILAGALALRFTVPLLRRVTRRLVTGAELASGESVRLGQDRRGAPVVLSDRQLAAHGLIVGASGAGKSTSLLAILSDAIARGRPVVAIDLKGSPQFAHTIAETAAAAGRPFRLWTPDGPNAWNPLRYGNATELKDKLIATERFTEPHYQRAAERYAQLALGVLQEIHPSRPVSLTEVVGAMEPRRLAALTRQLPAERATGVQEYLAGLTADQQSAVRGLGTRLAILTESHTGRYLEPAQDGGIDLRRALAGDEVVLFSLNSSVYGKLSAQLGTLAIQDLVTASGHRLQRAASPGAQTLIGIDEFSALGADNVISLLARGRESGVSVLLATQELADLDRAASGFRDQVVGVTGMVLAHRQNVPASARAIAQMAGTRKVWEQTYRFGQGPFARRNTSAGTRREVEQFIVQPNEIMSLRTGEAALITKVPSSQAQVVRVDPSPAPSAGGQPLAATPRAVGAPGPLTPTARRTIARDGRQTAATRSRTPSPARPGASRDGPER